MPEWIVKYWVEWVFGLVIAGMGWILKRFSAKLKKEKAEREKLAQQAADENKALKEGMKSLLRRQILADCEAAQKKGWCDSTTKGTIQAMYDAYHGLGGNDVVTASVHQVIDDLPIARIYREENAL